MNDAPKEPEETKENNVSQDIKETPQVEQPTEEVAQPEVEKEQPVAEEAARRGGARCAAPQGEIRQNAEIDQKELHYDAGDDSRSFRRNIRADARSAEPRRGVRRLPRSGERNPHAARADGGDTSDGWPGEQEQGPT